jgi:microcystin-dependent protein
MVSPPYSLNASVPGDSDIVSQFPNLDRSDKGVISAWISANHDSNGNHNNLIIVQGSAPSTPATGLNAVYATTTGRLKYILPDGSVNWVGTPPGNVQFTAATSIPIGWLVADGSAVSRATYADLFSAIGTTYGSGDGSTTFNVPDIVGRVIAGEDLGNGRLLSSYFPAPASQGTVGGASGIILTLSQIPQGISSTNAGTITVSTASGYSVPALNSNSVIGNAAYSSTSGTLYGPYNSSLNGPGWSGITSLTGNANTITSTSSNTGGGGHNNIQPTIILKAIIKT